MSVTIFRAFIPFPELSPHSTWCIDGAVWLLPLRSSHQNTSTCCPVSVALPLHTTRFPPILLVHPLVLLTLFSVLPGNLLCFARLLSLYTFFVCLFIFVSTGYITGQQYPKAVFEGDNSNIGGEMVCLCQRGKNPSKPSPKLSPVSNTFSDLSLYC